MKLRFTHDEVLRGAIVLGLGVLVGVLFGLLQYCERRLDREMAVLPSYSPFRGGVPPLIDRPALYSDFVFSLEGMPRFLPPWRTLIESEEVLGEETWRREWELLGDPTLMYPDDREVERALDAVLFGR